MFFLSNDIAVYISYRPVTRDTAQKLKFSIKDFFSKFDQIRSFLWIWSHLHKKYLMENFIFCAVRNAITRKDFTDEQFFCSKVCSKTTKDLKNFWKSVGCNKKCFELKKNIHRTSLHCVKSVRIQTFFDLYSA